MSIVYLLADTHACIKLGYAGRSATVTDMFLEADDAFFHKILYNKTHPSLILILT